MNMAILQGPFRPFFLLAAAHAVLGILVWAAFLRHGMFASVLLPDPFLWHGHTMITGFAGAIIAGFLLTASANWTGQKTATPTVLLLLLATWLLGRIAELQNTTSLLSLFADSAFWLLTVSLLLRVIIKTRNWRNLGFGVLPAAFWLVDLAWHLQYTGHVEGIARPALWLGVDLLTLIMGAMGGRIIPFFTSRRLPDASPGNPAMLALVGNMLLVAVLATNIFFRGEAPAAWVMLAAGIVLLLRLSRWNSFATRGEPMLWILHVGYAWLGIALLLRAAAIFTGAFPEATALHAVTVGALGALGLGMLARVALGHTGRMIVTNRLLTIAFVLVTLAAVTRIAAVFGAPSWLVHGVSSGAWALAFAIYLWQFVPIMFKPRADA